MISNPKKLLAFPSADSFRLIQKEKGELESLVLEPWEINKPIGHDVIVRVHATGMNFRDVLHAMGLYSMPSGFMGIEFAGTVMEVGDQVTTLGVGDEVFGIGSATFSNFVVVDENFAVPKPRNITFSQAATLATVYLTNYFSIIEVAKLQKGEKILIHSAAGGIGLSAINIAKDIGAEIFVTAGTEEKQNYLRSLGLKHVYHSRNYDYRDAILKDTQEQGVELVINSLTSKHFIATTVDVCAKNATFIELGRLNIWTPEKMKAARPDIHYVIVNFDEALLKESKWMKERLYIIKEKIESGKWKPLPVTEIPINDFISALHIMQKGEQIGKIVLTIPKKEKSK